MLFKRLDLDNLIDKIFNITEYLLASRIYRLHRD